MASYLDWMLINNPNELTDKDLRKAVSSMGSVANKRLRRMEEKGVTFGDNDSDETISGVRKFGVKGKSLSEVKREFKRVKNFLSNPQSSLRGMWETLKEVKRKWGRTPTKKIRKEFNKMEKQKSSLGKSMDEHLTRYEELQRWRDVWDYYNKLVEEGKYAPSSQDSNQVREIVYTKVSEQHEIGLSDRETWDRILADITNEYEQTQTKKMNDVDVSTSSLIGNYEES